MTRISFSALLLIALFLSFGNEQVIAAVDASSECDHPLRDANCTQEQCNALCVKTYGDKGKFGFPVYGVCNNLKKTCTCRLC
ncbi:hypothetical protein SLEP1_g18166 [Rubroshorea leprosula]|uniref:Uncharacterized protein n=1 Tax=Rubroshorea leprosula TaxID=152421 RepID=A0AAV5J5J8_9ROSI|nr:hypothetical protein SLEP1_g18166 [Rubroshorea leprosula]